MATPKSSRSLGSDSDYENTNLRTASEIEAERLAIKQANNNSVNLAMDFLRYCVNNPELRFWQAFLNWSGQKFILVSNKAPFELGANPEANVRDTFYWRGKDA